MRRLTSRPSLKMTSVGSTCAELHRRKLMLISVHHSEAYLAVIFFVQFFNHRADNTTGAAPRSPEVHDHRCIGVRTTV